eukprot:scpid28847/ scgid1107/ 
MSKEKPTRRSSSLPRGSNKRGRGDLSMDSSPEGSAKTNKRLFSAEEAAEFVSSDCAGSLESLRKDSQLENSPLGENSQFENSRLQELVRDEVVKALPSCISYLRDAVVAEVTAALQPQLQRLIERLLVKLSPTPSDAATQSSRQPVSATEQQQSVQDAPTFASVVTQNSADMTKQPCKLLLQQPAAEIPANPRPPEPRQIEDLVQAARAAATSPSTTPVPEEPWQDVCAPRRKVVLYVGGLSPTVTEERLRGYVTRNANNPAVIVVYKCQIQSAKPEKSTAFARLTVSAPTAAVLLSKGFWRGRAYCRRWVFNAPESKASQTPVSKDKGRTTTDDASTDTELSSQ